MAETEDGDDTVELEQADWRSPVADRVAAPSNAGPELLPFHERSWPDFERIILVVAEHVDGLRGVRLYGTPGQEQRGIDLWGTDHDGVNIGYQPKRLRSFDERDLAAAVKKFDGERRAVDARRLVICVACETDRTQVSETLVELRRSHPRFEIDLYDRRRLSEMLRSRPDLVRRLFGPDWAAAFCESVDWPIPERTTSDVLADALVRGPIVALGLEERFARCDQLAATEPVQAARELGSIIEALVNGNFDAFAAPLKLQQAELLLTSGDLPGGIEILTELSWKRIEAGGNNWDQHSLSRIRALLAKFDSPGARAFVAFADGINQWYGQPDAGLTDLLLRHGDLVLTEHPLVDSATLWILETAISTGDLHSAEAVSDAAMAAIARRQPRGLADEVNVRLRTALADAVDDWDSLLRDARSGRLGSRMATLVLMRYGRRCTYKGQPEDADAEYSLAIQRACIAGINAEAAAAVRSIIHLRMRFGSFTDDVNTMVQLAYQIESSGAVGLVPGVDGLDAGSLALSRDKLPEALRWYRTALRNSVIRGDLTDENAALVGLVNVLARSKERAAALQYALASGSIAATDECFPLPAYIDVRSWLSAEPYWQRATAFLTVSKQSDLIPDADVPVHVDLALDAIGEPRRGMFAPHVDLNAWKALAALSARASEPQAGRALELVESRIERERNHYRFEDDDLIDVVVSIESTQPGLRERAAELLARMIEQGDNFADDVRRAIVRERRSPHPHLLSRLTTLADAGHQSALQTLGDLDVRHADLLDSVRADVAALLGAPPPVPGRMEFGTWLPRTARRARVLDEAERIQFALHCAALAEDRTRPESNRTEGAEGVLLLSDHLPVNRRSELFARMMTLAADIDEPTHVDRQLLGGLHPLSTFRFDLDFGSLPREALQAAAALAVTADEAAVIAALATTRLVSHNVKEVDAATTALWYLDRASVELNVRLLLAHPVARVRQLAAAVSVQSDHPNSDDVMRLANDMDPSVRRVLASGVKMLAERNDELGRQVFAVLSKDDHWSVRQQLESDS